ncbi:MAG: MEKHLA domain-containing protein [Monoraphidium minutum]|nr:MAG: MEKHLA domain-containing protein [Monoraphidium minutum]
MRVERPALARRAPRAPTVAVRAAKKGGGGKEKKGAQKKGGSALAGLLKKKAEAEGGGGSDEAELATPAQYADPELNLLLLSICQSYWKEYNEYLMTTDLKNLAAALYNAPFVCLAHNKFEEGVEDPVFVYANRAALRLFEGTWDELVGLPSRLSADDTAQEERNALLQQAADAGGIKNYEGWRRSLKGRRFRIKGVRLFNVREITGDLYGQATVFEQYEEEDGTLVTVQGDAPPAVELPPTEEELAAAEAAVVEQGAAVRALKEGKGLTNKDAEVVAAVAELKARKDAQAALQRRWEEMVGGSLEESLEGDEE